MTRQALTMTNQPKVAVANGWLILCLSVTLVSCSSVTGVSSRAPARESTANPTPDGSGIVVIPNPYVDDRTLAYAAADQAKAELTKRGYTIVSSEDQAQLVAIPTVETNFVSEAPERVTPVGASPAALAPQIDRLGITANTFDSLPSFSGRKPSGTIKPGGKVLVIEAFNKGVWDKALIVNELQLAPAWKLRMPLPRELEPAVEGAAFARTADNQPVLPR